jgi:phosphatidylglycerophosphate synthase
MIDQNFRPWLEKRSKLLSGLYKRLGLSPNAITLAGCALGGLAAIAAAAQAYWIALGLWWAGRLLDGTDGIYARATGQVSDFGGYLDILCDMAAYGLMVLGFAYAMPDLVHYWIWMLFLYVLCITSALALGSVERRRKTGAKDNRTMKLAAGIAEGGETGIFYSLVLVFPSWAGWFSPVWILILTVTVVARSLVAYRELR